jgi:hypothetical protein
MMKINYPTHLTAPAIRKASFGYTVFPFPFLEKYSRTRHLLKKYNHLLNELVVSAMEDRNLQREEMNSHRRYEIQSGKGGKFFLVMTFIYLYICLLFFLTAFSYWMPLTEIAKHFLGLKLNRPIFNVGILHRGTFLVSSKPMFRNQTFNT